ncbi:MAG: serine/threonine-protein kinase [Acidobacteriota bacterium]
MSLDRKRQILEILHQALGEEAESRPALVARLCGADEALRQEVLGRLDPRSASGVLEAPIFDVRGEDPAIGRRVGGYRLVELLGRGGMGTVYLAEREDFEQRVAIKLIRRGFDLDPVVVQRFHNERQILARLEHPYIARLLGGGATGDRLPYLVMEHVEGEAIDAYCRRVRPGLAALLALFCKVCEAVHFAHQNLVVHRDLKPGNILITASGEPKLLDFGIAKLLDDKLAFRPLATATGQAPLTPRYASPEQLQHQPVSTVSDVYVLGVLLFELLTGLTLFPEAQKDDDPSGEQWARALLQHHPPKPSTAVRRRAEEIEPGGMSLEKLRRRLAGDLDSIVLKAIRKRPDRRYASAERLADDLRRHLAGEPVSARAASWRYRAGKFLRRYRLQFAVAFALLASAFSLHLHSQNLMRDALDQTLNVFDDLGLGAGAGSVAEANALIASPRIPEYLRGRVQCRLAALHRQAGRLPEAERNFREGVEKLERSLGSHQRTATCLNNLGAVYFRLERYEEAGERYQQALDMKRELGSPESDLLRVRSNLAAIQRIRGSFERSREAQLKILQDRRREAEPNYKSIYKNQHNLAVTDLDAGEFESALKWAHEALDGRQGLEEEEKGRVLLVASTQDLIGRILIAQGLTEEAEWWLLCALESRREELASKHPKVAETRRSLAETLLDKDPERSARLLEQALASFRDSNPESWRVADALSVQAVLLAREGEREKAERQARSAYERIAEVRSDRSTVALQARERWLTIASRSPERKGVALPAG